MAIFKEINRINNLASKNGINQDIIMERTSRLFYNLKHNVINVDNENSFAEMKIESMKILLCLFYAVFIYNKELKNKDHYNIFIKKYRVELSKYNELLELLNEKQIEQFVEDIEDHSLKARKIKYLSSYFQEVYNKFRGFLGLYYSRDKNDDKIIPMINEQLAIIIYELSFFVVGAISGNNKFLKVLNSKDKALFLEEFRLLIAENDWVVFTKEEDIKRELLLRKKVLEEIKQEGNVYDLIMNENLIKIIKNSINSLLVIEKK